MEFRADAAGDGWWHSPLWLSVRRGQYPTLRCIEKADLQGSISLANPMFGAVIVSPLALEGFALGHSLFHSFLHSVSTLHTGWSLASFVALLHIE